MKILILTDKFPPSSFGGAAIIASVHASVLDQYGYEVVVVTTVDKESEVGEFYENNIKIIKLYSDYHTRFRSYLSIYNPFILKDIKKIMKKEMPDIVHAHNIHYYLSYHSLYIAKKYSKAIFMTIHDSMSFHYSKLFPEYPYETITKSYKISFFKQIKDFKFRFNPIKNLLIRYYLRIPDKIFAVSNALKDALLDNNIKNVEVIHNGIDTDKWQATKSNIDNFKNKYNLLNKKVIMFCGRLSGAKGGELLINNLSKIVDKIDNSVLLIIGDKDNEASNIINNANIPNIDKYLVFTGKLDRESIINAYGASNILVAPSICFDWFPTVNLEAMAMRLPVIATCFGGSKEAIKQDINGYIINPYNSEDFVNKIIDLLNDNEKAIRFGNAGYEIVKRDFSLDEFIKKTVSWYNRFLIK